MCSPLAAGNQYCFEELLEFIGMQEIHCNDTDLKTQNGEKSNATNVTNVASNKAVK